MSVHFARRELLMIKISELARKNFICVILFLLGAKLLDRDHLLSVGRRISYGEMLFILYFFGVLLKVISKNSISWLFFSSQQKKFTYLLTCFAIWTGLSWGINTIFRNGDIMDFFGIPVRVLFYCFMSVFVARWVKRYGPNIVVIPFCIGILAMFYFNFAAGVVTLTDNEIPNVIAERNFSGVLLPVGAIFLALLVMINPTPLAFILMCFSFASTLLIYSLGGYLFVLMGFPAVLVSIYHFFINREIRMNKRFFTLAILFFLGIIIFTKFGFVFGTIFDNIEKKYNNIPFVEAARGDVQSGDYRWGFLLSSLEITMNNPMFGVGEYNWKAENLKNKEWLGKIFYDHKNPHNGLAQILSMFGIPAFLLFMSCFFITFKGLYALHAENGLKWKIFVLSSFLVFFGSANVMSTIFTTYYFYFYAAFIFGIEGRFSRPLLIPANRNLYGAVYVD